MGGYRITTPVRKFTGEVAGVQFVDGLGSTDNLAVLPYFRRHGYGIEEIDAVPAEVEQTPVPADIDPPKRPAPSGTKAAWKAYAITQGMSEAEAEAATRDALAERFAAPTTPEEGQL